MSNFLSIIRLKPFKFTFLLQFLCNVNMFSISLFADITHLQNALIHEGKEMASVLYTYRSCVKALPQVKMLYESI